MGVLCDYFRAADDGAARKLMAENSGGPVLTSDSAPADVVSTKGIDPSVILGKLVALALDTPWSTGLTGADLVWPEDAEDDPDYHGPWVTRLRGPARDALAGVTGDQAPALAERWTRIEELAGHQERPTLEPLIRDFAALAGRARAAGDSLYCWICL